MQVIENSSEVQYQSSFCLLGQRLVFACHICTAIYKEVKGKKTIALDETITANNV